MDVPEVNPPPSLAEKIEAVLATLETQGLAIDIEQRVRLETLLLRLAADGQIPESADDVSNLLTPILAGTSAQQAMCRSTFKTVFITDRETPKSDPVKPRLDRDNVSDRMRWLRSAILAKVLVAGVALFVGASVFWAGLVLFAPTQTMIKQIQIMLRRSLCRHAE